MPRKSASQPARKATPRKPRTARAKPAPPSRWGVALLVAAAVAIAGYRFRDRLPIIAPSADTQLAQTAVKQHSALMISEIIQPVRMANTGDLTGEQVLKIIQTAHPVIDRSTWSPLADRITELQHPDTTPDGKPHPLAGRMNQQQLDAFLDEVEAGFQ